jgi:VTC domain.
LKNSNVPEIIFQQLKFLRSYFLNSYKRKYYLSADKKFRITIDKKIKHYEFLRKNNLDLKNFVNDYNIIMELKYDNQNDFLANKITNFFPFRLTKSSKYVCGMSGIFN